MSNAATAAESFITVKLPMGLGPFGFRFNLPEFAFGLLLAVVLFLILRRIWPDTARVKAFITHQWESLKRYFTSSAVEPYRQELLSHLDSSHLASPILSLQELMIPPRVLIPPPPRDPLHPDPEPDRYHQILPNLPDWQTLAAIYQSPSLAIDYFLDVQTNLLLTGELGTGKTTSLAYLAHKCTTPPSSPAQQDPRIPVYVHIANLDITAEDPLQAVISAVQKTVSIRLAQLIPNYLMPHLLKGEVLFLLDGLDELPTVEIKRYVPWLIQFRNAVPQVQIIAAAPPTGYDGLHNAGFIPLPIAPWGKRDLRQFLDRWASSWQKEILPKLGGDRLGSIDPVLLNAWLEKAITSHLPLEITAQVWAAYVGDQFQFDSIASLDGYLGRILSDQERKTAQSIALSWIRSGKAYLSLRDIGKNRTTNELEDKGILIERGQGLVGFAIPSVGAFLAGKEMSEQESIPPPDDAGWLPIKSALRFSATSRGISDSVKAFLQEKKDPTCRSILTCAYWLEYAPSDAQWRNLVLKDLAKILHNPALAYGLRLRALHAFIAAREVSAKTLFERLIKHQSAQSRNLGALGLGGLKLDTSIPLLRESLATEDQDQVKFSICLAFAAIGTEDALKELANLLLHGSEVEQLLAADALAIHPSAGIPMLKEAAAAERVRTRRAAVYGLGRIPGEHITRLLERIQLEDDQWIVKNAAEEILERRETRHLRLPPLSWDLASLPWLITHAAEAGMGIAPGKGAMEMLRKVLQSGSVVQKIAAFESLGWHGSRELMLEVEKALGADDEQVRDAAFEALWWILASDGRIAAAS